MSVLAEKKQKQPNEC